ncbi:MAG: alpha/beta hydrolase [Hyphomicrobiales bacterium]
MRSPNLFAKGTGYPSAELLPSQKTTTPRLFYVTDRQPNNSGSYDAKRSPSMAFGHVDVSYGNGLSWNNLVEISNSSKQAKSIPLQITKTTETTRFPRTPLPFSVQNGQIKTLPQSQNIYDAKTAEVHGTLSTELQKTNRKDIVLFIHGFNNSFEHAAFSLADVWHYTGRVGVPVFYSWPAGNRGLTGYFKDTEAVKFSIFHFKEAIRVLSSTPGLERIHIVAHSRGTEVVTTGLRELVIEDRARGLNPKQSLKIQNLILAAPDLDFGVVQQRLIAERFGPAIGQITVYLNQNDGALGLSQRIASGQRFGRLTFDDLDEGDKQIFSRVKNVHFVNIQDVQGLVKHAYFRENPGVLSDIAIAIRYNAPPGHPKRPLENTEINFWELPKGYPFQ